MCKDLQTHLSQSLVNKALWKVKYESLGCVWSTSAIEKYFVPGLDQDLRLLFVQIKGKTKKNMAQAPRRGVTIIEEVMLQWAATAESLFLSNL